MAATGAHADCRLRVFATFPLQPNPDRLLAEGAVNGKPAVFILDTGAQISSMPYPEAKRLGVQIVVSNNMTSEGIGGSVATGEGRFDMKLGGIDLPREEMTVLAMPPLDNDAVGLVGLDLLAQRDMELDLPDKAVRLVKVEGCAANQLAYWNKPYSQTPLEPDGSPRPQILLNVMLNGHSIPAQIDSGSPQSIVTPAAAKAAGVDVGAGAGRPDLGGVGVHRVGARVVRFDSFTIGDETIRNAELIVSDMWKYNQAQETGTRLGSYTKPLGEPRMLLGADFLRAHRVLVVNSMRLLVFSYVGGPVFDTAQPPPGPGQTAPGQTAPGQTASDRSPAR